MCTIDRINAILRQLKGNEITMELFFGRGHDVLDAIDKRLGIITRYDPYVSGYRQSRNNPAPLGNRLRRLERHVFKEEAPPFFWLGAEALSS